jgi:hypothetical protein
MYALENTDFEFGYILFYGKWAYQQALILCDQNTITGNIVYCLTRTSQKIVNGEPIKRGRKKKETRTDKIGAGFFAQIPQPPKNITPV